MTESDTVYDDTLLERTQRQNNNPEYMVQRLLECEYTHLGKSKIDGIAVEGFRTTDPALMGGMMSDLVFTIWVDQETRLPVRSEMEMNVGEQVHMKGSTHSIQWDVSVEASLFEPKIPDDYENAAAGIDIKIPGYLWRSPYQDSQ
ncbi:hypothetical protein ACFL6U_04490 [Planctomycetota bacterium]